MNQQQSIRLGQYLKLVGLVASGGEAKHIIQQGLILVNGEVETRRKKQLYAGDVVELEDRTFTVAFEDPPGAPV